MVFQKLAYRTQGKDRNDVYIVREEEKYGLIVMACQGDDMPDALSREELSRQGGSFISEPQWDEIRENICFDPIDAADGTAPDEDNITCNYYVLKNGLWGILDEKGRVLREPFYEEITIVNDYENMGGINSSLRHGFSPLEMAAISACVLVRRGEKWGMIRSQGAEVLPLDYDSISIVCYHWAEGNVYIVRKDGLCGVVDKSGKFYIPLAYPSLHCDGLEYLWDSTVFRIDGEAGTGYVRLGDGKCLASPEWDRIDEDRLYLPGDAEPDEHIFTVWKDGHCGLILDDEGMIIPPVWDEIVPRRFTFEDPVSYSVRRGTRWGCCDASGHMICDAIWDEVDMHLNGIGCVRKDGKWGAIGADGKLCVPLEWDDIEGFGVKSASEDAMAHTNMGALLGLRRSKTTTLPDCFSWVRRNGLWGLIDREGNVVAEPVWELHDGDYARRFDGKWFDLEVCRVMPGDEEAPTEDEKAGHEVEMVSSDGKTTYRIVVREVKGDVPHDDGSAEESDSDEAPRNDAFELLLECLANADLDEDWDDDSF